MARSQIWIVLLAISFWTVHASAAASDPGRGRPPAAGVDAQRLRPATFWSGRHPAITSSPGAGQPPGRRSWNWSLVLNPARSVAWARGRFGQMLKLPDPDIVMVKGRYGREPVRIEASRRARLPGEQRGEVRGIERPNGDIDHYDSTGRWSGTRYATSPESFHAAEAGHGEAGVGRTSDYYAYWAATHGGATHAASAEARRPKPIVRVHHVTGPDGASEAKIALIQADGTEETHRTPQGQLSVITAGKNQLLVHHVPGESGEPGTVRVRANDANGTVRDLRPQERLTGFF